MRIGGRSVLYGRIPRGPYRVEKTIVGAADKAVAADASIVSKAHWFRTAKDTSNSPDAVKRGVLRPRPVTDKANAGDLLVRKITFFRLSGITLYPGVTVYPGPTTWLGTLSLDAINSIDVGVYKPVFNREIADTAPAIEALSAKLKFIRALADEALSIDLAARSGGHFAFLVEKAKAGDETLRHILNARSLAETVNASDSLSRLASHPRLVSDLATVTELTIAVGSTGEQFLGEFLPTGDAASRSGIAISRAITDEEFISDSTTERYVFKRAIVDNVLGADATSKISTFTRLLLDKATNQDAIQRHIATNRALTDGSLSADALLKKIHLRGSAFDTLLMIDGAAANAQHFYPLLFDTVLTSDIATAPFRGLVREISDHILSGEVVTMILSLFWETGKFDYIMVPYRSKISNITFLLPHNRKERFVVENNLQPIQRFVHTPIAKKLLVESRNS